MMGTTLHWVDGPWPGKLALAARPRGGEWLGDEVAHWKAEGIDTVVSLLEAQEERDLGLSEEKTETQASGMTFRSFPIVDRQVPESDAAVGRFIEQLEGELASGRNVVLHCRQGIGRTGLIAASLLVGKGLDPVLAMERLSRARGVEMPETAQQRVWIEHFAETLTAAR